MQLFRLNGPIYSIVLNLIRDQLMGSAFRMQNTVNYQSLQQYVIWNFLFIYFFFTTRHDSKFHSTNSANIVRMLISGWATEREQLLNA